VVAPAIAPAPASAVAPAPAQVASTRSGAAPPKAEKGVVVAPGPRVALAAGPLPAAIGALLEQNLGKKVAVPVSVGKHATGYLTFLKKGDEVKIDGKGRIPFDHPKLRQFEALRLSLDVDVVGGEVTGKVMSDAGEGLSELLKSKPAQLGMAGLKLPKPDVTSDISGGRVGVNAGFTIEAGIASGPGSLRIDEDTVTFTGTLDIRVPAPLKGGSLALRRNATTGLLEGTAKLGVTLGPVSGMIDATYVEGGTFTIVGAIEYDSRRFAGKLNVTATNQKEAKDISAGAAPAATPAVGSAAAKAPAKQTEKDLVVVGWGELQFQLTPWLAGTAKVSVDAKNDIDVIGKITPPAEVVLLAQRDTVKELLSVSLRAIYGAPVVGNVFIEGKAVLSAVGKVGPLKLYNLVLEGTWSSDPKKAKSFVIKGSLNMSAYAGLRLRAEASAGVTVLDHDIKAGLGVNADAGVKGYIEATPTIGMRDVAGDKGEKIPEYFIKGDIELAAQPVIGLSGDLFVEIDAPWWSPVPDKKWVKPLGSLEYPLPGQFGIAASVDYVLGSDRLPEVTFGKADFDAAKFGTDLINDHIPPKTAKPPPKGVWGEGGGSSAPGAKPATGASSGAGVTQAKPVPKDQPPLPPETVARMQAVAKDLESLRTAGEKDPYDEMELTRALLALKTKHALKSIVWTSVGDSWSISATVNPVITTKAIAKSNPAAKAVTGKHAGFIKYGSIDQLGRPTGVTARLDASRVNSGSDARAAIRPPGFEGGAAGHQRGHLLAKQLGGSGDDERNLVTIYQYANHPVMSGLERRVRKMLEAGNVVDYKVAVMYQGNERLPIALTISARSTDGSDVSISVWNRPK
jgi:hypothetical protein